ncbi:MAG: autotransporter-associated beta strand repeat-containing protein [Thermoguttaceae bacterium]|jgi:autotransporter-associated beta strand protein
MRSADDIERLLSEAPVPQVRAGSHRTVLLRELLARIENQAGPAAGLVHSAGGAPPCTMPPTPVRRILQPRWIAAAAAATAAVLAAAILVVERTSERAVVARSEPAPPAATVSSGTAGRLPSADTSSFSSLSDRPAATVSLGTAGGTAPKPPQATPAETRLEQLSNRPASRLATQGTNGGSITYVGAVGGSGGSAIGGSGVLILTGSGTYSGGTQINGGALLELYNDNVWSRWGQPLDQQVAGAKVIVAATAVESAPAPPKVPGNPPENYIRFRVTRALKGKLTEEVITVRTPTAAREFIGKAWIVMLSAEYLAGKRDYAGCYPIQIEPEVKAILSKAAK